MSTKLSALLIALALAIAPGAIVAQSRPQVPRLVWGIDSDDDTTFVLPFGVAVDQETHTLFVADLSIPGVVEIDANTGHVVRVIGRRGDGPGEFRVPQRLAISPNGRFIGVYDVGRSTVDIFDREWRYVRRSVVGGFHSLKSFGITNDTNLVLSGARIGTDQRFVGVTWHTPAGVRGVGPEPPNDPELAEDARADTRLYAGGGPGYLAGSEWVLADATTGDLWSTSPGGARKVAAGPGAPPGLLRSIVVANPGGTGGQRARTINFGFRQAVLAEPNEGGALVYMSDQRRELLEVYQVQAGAPARLVAAWKVKTSVVARLDERHIVTVGFGDDGWRIVAFEVPR